MRKYTLKQCPVCGKDFKVTSRKPKQKTCSQACRHRLTSPIPEPVYQPKTDTYAIPISNCHTVTLDACDIDLAVYCWTPDVKPIRDAVYAFRSLPRVDGKRKHQYLHRVILSRMLNRELTRYEKVDHQNRDGLDCRRSNLRLADNGQNAANSKQRSDNTSGYKGVHWAKRAKKWAASIHIAGKHIHLGLFADPAAAHTAYVTAAREHFGEFANDGLTENPTEK